jgi:hypothetical protein
MNKLTYSRKIMRSHIIKAMKAGQAKTGQIMFGPAGLYAIKCGMKPIPAAKEIRLTLDELSDDGVIADSGRDEWRVLDGFGLACFGKTIAKISSGA